mmetsp:Transcript_57505/g.161323  ORF Transcript_57505/g.161323 Transcript_57505/m.161323 type:complete len:231 (+) Transcript_57505:191-883(+)
MPPACAATRWPAARPFAPSPARPATARSASTASLAFVRSSRTSALKRELSPAVLRTRASHVCTSSFTWLSMRSRPWILLLPAAISELELAKLSRSSPAVAPSSALRLAVSCCVPSSCRSTRNRSCCASSRSPQRRSISTLCMELCRSSMAFPQDAFRSASSALVCISRTCCSQRRSCSSPSATARLCAACRLSYSWSRWCVKLCISPCTRLSRRSTCRFKARSAAVQASF